MRLALALFAVTGAFIVAVWAWLGAPVTMAHSPLAAGEKLACVSYAPFRDGQTPLDPSTHIPAAQIEEDLTQLARLTKCVRTYSVDGGLDQIAEIADRHGLKVMQGLWLSNDRKKNSYQIETAIALANRFPDVIQSVVVGNEVLLRGDLGVDDLAEIVRNVKARVHVPVTYADVWEFWLRNAQLAAAVDFVTIHILPYWEDVPIPARNAAAHVDAIMRKVKAAFPGKEVMIGEVGWPSRGRMREGALPSPSNQARVIQDVLALAGKENFRVNIIEAYDQPWKRALEGTVGGHWGLIDAGTRSFKFEWGAPVSDHPWWRWEAFGGVVFSAAIFIVAFIAVGDGKKNLVSWLAVALNAAAGGVLIGWAVINVPLESIGAGGWLRSVALVAAALFAPPLVSVAIMRAMPLPAFEQVIGPRALRLRDPLKLAAGGILVVLTLIAIQIALGLAFDPRYRDFPFAPLSAAIVPFVVHGLVVRQSGGARAVAEMAAAGVLALCAVYVVINEGFANWQSLWFCAAIAALAFTLARARAAQS